MIRDDWRTALDNVAALSSRIQHEDVSGGLAICREHPGDVRPEILLWHIAHEDRFYGVVYAHVRLRVQRFVEVRGIRVRPAIVSQATIGAMSIVRGRTGPDPAADTAKALGIRKSTYLVIRKAAVGYLVASIDQGFARLNAAFAQREPQTPASRHAAIRPARIDASNAALPSQQGSLTR